MGCLRVILALWVVLTHGEAFFGRPVPQAWVAVQCFFIISGFYMSLILDQKYCGAGAWRKFYGSRLLRLFPMYWLVLVLSVGSAGVLWGWAGHALGPVALLQEHGGRLDAGSVLLLGVSNLFILGQDALNFMGLDAAGSFFWTANFREHPPELWQFLFIPQAWSIELELCFYALAPWLLRWRSRRLLVVVACSLALRAAIYAAGWRHDPWTYRFFPAELALFLMGAFSYRFSRSPAFARWRESRGVGLLLGAVFGLAVIFPWIPLPGQIKAWPFYLLTMAAVPFLFDRTKNLRWDRWVGELSYPVYIGHYWVVGLCAAFLPAGWQEHRSLVAAAGSLLLAVALQEVAGKRLEAWRQSRLPPDRPAPRSPAPVLTPVPAGGAEARPAV